MRLDFPITLTSDYRDYIWGGQRLRPGQRTAEAWVLYEDNRVANGPQAGRTLTELSTQYGAVLLGSVPAGRSGTRFPLLIKLLDCAEWLSLQVHPNDAQAEVLEGAGHNGKTEAWFILEAAANAQLVAGLRPGVSTEQMARAVRVGTILNDVKFLSVNNGDAILMPAGTIHALGPGLMVYEVQQVSDITYRVFDWDRPATPGRALHIEKSLVVINPAAASLVTRPQSGLQRQSLARCEYFHLEQLEWVGDLLLDTAGQSFHALTVIEGEVDVTASGGACHLDRYATALMPAACRGYTLSAGGLARVLLASAGGLSQ